MVVRPSILNGEIVEPLKAQHSHKTKPQRNENVKMILSYKITKWLGTDQIDKKCKWKPEEKWPRWLDHTTQTKYVSQWTRDDNTMLTEDELQSNIAHLS